MDAITNLLWPEGRFLGIYWHFWKVVGWLGNVAFFSRFLVQWYATEKHQRVVVPSAFWWLSLAGSGMLLSYALFYQKDSVFIFAYAFTWIPYVRNLMIQHRHRAANAVCVSCGGRVEEGHHFCPHCGKGRDHGPSSGEELSATGNSNV